MKTALKSFIVAIVLIILTSSLSAGISASELNIGIPVEEHPELFWGRTMPTHGEGKIAVFLIQFPDYKNDNPNATVAYYNELYFASDSLNNVRPNSPWSCSVASYYHEQSLGNLTLSGQVFDWYTTKHERAYYNTDAKKKELVLEVISHFEASGTSFAQFDGDDNGTLDAVIYHFAGPADEGLTEPWYDGVAYSAPVGKTASGHEIKSFIQIDNSIDVNTYNSERLRRTICHELLHTLGMDDLYGQNWEPLLNPVEDLMSGDTYTINPYYKILLGWTDNVKLVTSNTADVQLNVWEQTGETILVAENFEGIFDEFYLIAYAWDQVHGDPQIRIWHVDARLNEAGTEFLYDNLSYCPDPTKTDTHITSGSGSTYLFMEEISAIPYSDYVLNYTNSLYFREGSILAPGSIPGTDSHDGNYTGIKIDDFKVFGTHASMDITFDNKDTSAPKISDAQSILGFTQNNKLVFNEYIYPSSNWDKIKITTLSGEEIPATFTRGHYLRYEISIAASAALPKEGYQIFIPESAFTDAAGNKNAEMTIPVLPNEYVFEKSREYISWYYPNETRFWEQRIFGFTWENESILITASGKGDNQCAFIEFTKLNANGNIVSHIFIDNPYPGSFVLEAINQANDGSYLIHLRQQYNGLDALLCVDKDGALRWHKRAEAKLQLGHIYLPAVAYKNGILFCGQWRTFIDVQTGEIADTQVGGTNFNDICYNGSRLVGFVRHLSQPILVINPETLKIEERYALSFDGISQITNARISYNPNGTYIILAEAKNDQGESGLWAVKLDANLQKIKEIFLKSSLAEVYGSSILPEFYPNDGFIASVCNIAANHSNATYTIFRVDNNLNLMWETTIETHEVAFFVTASNNICAFSSYWSPDRNAYLLQLGSEDAFEIISHTMIHRNASNPTCIAEGQREHWLCTECGKYFSDADGIKEIAATSVTIPKISHTEAFYPEVKPDCTNDGSTGGSYCKVCNAQLTPKTTIKAIGHTPVIIPATAPTCTSTGMTEGLHCSSCQAVLVEQTTIQMLPHSPISDKAIEPTCTESGLTEGEHCSVCQTVLKAQVPVEAKGHTEVEDEAIEPTTEKEGLTAGSHCSVCGTVIKEQETIEKLEPETSVQTEPKETEKTASEIIQATDKIEEPAPSPSNSDSNPTVVLIIIGSGVLLVVSLAVIIKKRK